MQGTKAYVATISILGLLESSTKFEQRQWKDIRAKYIQDEDKDDDDDDE